MIVKCGYCGRCLSEKEYLVLNRKVRVSKKRKKTCQIFHPSDSDISEIKSLTGGEKHQWLKIHKMEILQYLEENGDAESRRHYGISRIDILPGIEDWQCQDDKKEFSDLKLKINILESKNNSLHSQVAMMRALMPDSIEKLSPEEQVKILTFKLYEAVSKLKITRSAADLNLSDMFDLKSDGKITLKEKVKV